MSATKSIVNLAIGRLIDMGKITSIDQPVHEIYLEWKQGRKKLITVRHLLNHTSSIQDNRTTSEIYPSPDFVQLALAAELSDDPGTRFFYNNKAVNLLAGIVRRASGERMDVFIGKEIFGPLGIHEFGWTLDPAGNPHAMAGLQIRAIDLARNGQLMLDEGSWKGRQVVSKEWVRRSLEPGQPFDPTCGLLWWLDYGRPTKLMVDNATVKYFKDMGMTPRSLEKVEALKGKAMEAEAILAALRPIVGPDPGLRTKVEVLRTTMPPLKPAVEGPPRGFAAQGYAGQHLFVMPRHRLVAVRQRRRREGSNPDDPKGYFLEFMDLVAALVRDEPGR
jgi:CubicO group peptidase (beta-lactamase class C family)